MLKPNPINGKPAGSFKMAALYCHSINIALLVFIIFSFMRQKLMFKFFMKCWYIFLMPGPTLDRGGGHKLTESVTKWPWPCWRSPEGQRDLNTCSWSLIKQNWQTQYQVLMIIHNLSNYQTYIKFKWVPWTIFKGDPL